jgi:hypothetical protein
MPVLPSDHRRHLPSLLTLLAAALAVVPLVAAQAAPPSPSEAEPAVGQYRNFAVGVYIPVRVVQRLADRQTLETEWNTIRRQVKVDKVYIESHRDRVIADEALLESLKQFFVDRGVRVAGGITFSDGGAGQFRSFCYTSPEDRAFVKRVSELTARHFDEIILDDFFFVTTKYASDIAAKGERTWSQFRVDLMNQASEELVLAPARKVNPRARVIIKYPNWYEHFQGLGFDLERGPQLFDGIYTGTETRDPATTDQFLQQYLSYQIYRYFENIKPGANGGGWIDTFNLGYIDRYAQQLWDTMFAKAREITLFNWAALVEPIRPGERSAWAAQPTSFNFERMLEYHATEAPASSTAPTWARAAGYTLDQVDVFLGKLGRPIGIRSYKPHHSTGEDFLHNYIGMLGVPIDLHASFPAGADVVLLTEAAKFDPQIVGKIEDQLAAGKSVVITSGLLRALSGKGIEDIVELEHTERRIVADGYTAAFGAGGRRVIGVEPGSMPILFPQIRFHTNDAWALVSATADKVGFPLLLMDRYAQGVLYVWTMPDNPHHLYRLPAEVTTAIKDVVMRGFFVRIDGPSQVALYAYDNNTFIVESYLPTDADVKVSVAGDATKLRNLVTDAVLSGRPPAPPGPMNRQQEPRTSFDVHLPPHSYGVFAVEK